MTDLVYLYLIIVHRIVRKTKNLESLESLPQARSQITKATGVGVAASASAALGSDGVESKLVPTHTSRALARRRLAKEMPQWHAPWKLMRVISGHIGWVRSIAVEPGNEWFVTGSADRTIKVR